MCQYEDTLYFHCNHEVRNTLLVWQCPSAQACHRMDNNFPIGSRTSTQHENYYSEKEACELRNERAHLTVQMGQCPTCRSYMQPTCDPFTRLHMELWEIGDPNRPPTPENELKLLVPMIPELAREMFKGREKEVPHYQEHDARAMLAACYFLATHLAGQKRSMEQLLRLVQSANARTPIEMVEVKFAYLKLFESRMALIHPKYLGRRMGDLARLPVARNGVAGVKLEEPRA